MVPASAFTVEGADAAIGLRFFLPPGTAQDRQRYGYFSGRAALGVLRMNFQKLDLFPTTLSKYCGAAGRRSGAKLAICSAIFLAGAFFLADEFAGARGAFNMGPPTGIGTVFEAPPPVFVPPEVRPIERIERSAPARRRYATKRGSRAAVCVRLCDGFYFPSVNTSGGDEGCASQCPDAPTVFYSEPPGSDRIEDAVSLQGAPYSALPVANRHQTSFDGTCTCHHSFLRSYLADLRRDPTLRDGDLVMTDKGFAVFKSDKSRAVSAANFVALSQSPNVAKNWRAELTAMERAGMWERQSGPYSYSYPATETTQTSTAAPRLHKGTVTVDDGDAPR
jgi:hypothetical protein